MNPDVPHQSEPATNSFKVHETTAVINQEPSATGTRADLQARVDISKVHGGYFSSPEVAKAFVDLGIKDIEAALPQRITYADFGGGQGFLTKQVTEYLRKLGHDVEAWVVDGNPDYLSVAEEAGLHTKNENLEDTTLTNLDLVTMRAVNHYNPIDRQLALLQKTSAALKAEGVLLSQISSGSESNTRLRSAIVNLQSLGRASEGDLYHWTTIEEYTGLLHEAGFLDNEVVGYAPNARWTPLEQWNRFHQAETKKATEERDAIRLKKLEDTRAAFLYDASNLIQEAVVTYGAQEVGVVYGPDHTAIIEYPYPIIRSQKKEV